LIFGDGRSHSDEGEVVTLWSHQKKLEGLTREPIKWANVRLTHPAITNGLVQGPKACDAAVGRNCTIVSTAYLSEWLWVNP
jgi:hypothetical protein